MCQRSILPYVVSLVAALHGHVAPAVCAEEAIEYETSCKANMQALGEGVRLYIMLTGGKWPQKLSDLYNEGAVSDLSLFTCPASGHILETVDQIDAQSHYIMSTQRAPTPMLLFKEKYGYHNDQALAYYSNRTFKRVDASEPPPSPKPQIHDTPPDINEPADVHDPSTAASSIGEAMTVSNIPTLPPISPIPDLPPMNDPAIRHTSTVRTASSHNTSTTNLPTTQDIERGPTQPDSLLAIQIARANELVEKGQSHWGAQEWDQAEKAFREAIRLNPNNPEAHNGLGGTLARQGNWASAESSFQAAHQLKPNHYLYAGHLAIALMKQEKDYEQAERLLIHAIKQKPDEADLHYQYGGVLRFQERWEESMAAYRQAIKIDPEKAKYYADMTWALIALNRREEARQAVNRAKALGMSNHPTYAMVDKWGPTTAPAPPSTISQQDPKLNGFAQLLWNGQYDKALQESRRLSDLYPNDAQVNVCRGLMELVHRENETATAIAKRLIQRYPDQINVIVLRAQTALWSGDTDMARKMFAKAMQLNPNTAATYYQQGVQFYSHRLWLMAYYQFFTVLYLGGPGSTDAHFYLGVVCEQLNDPRQAIAQYQAYLNATPTGQVADQARAAVARLTHANR